MTATRSNVSLACGSCLFHRAQLVEPEKSRWSARHRRRRRPRDRSRGHAWFPPFPGFQITQNLGSKTEKPPAASLIPPPLNLSQSSFSSYMKWWNESSNQFAKAKARKGGFALCSNRSASVGGVPFCPRSCEGEARPASVQSRRRIAHGGGGGPGCGAASPSVYASHAPQAQSPRDLRLDSISSPQY
jgi:hypothetical protein